MPLSVYVLPIAKYSSLYEPFVVTLSNSSSLASLRSSVYQTVAKTTDEKTACRGEYVYKKKHPKSVQDIRLFRFIRSSSLQEREEWEKNMDLILFDEPRQEWILKTILKQSRDGSVFDWQCGNELEGEEEHIVDLLPYRPSYLDCTKSELFCFFDVVEALDPQKDILFINTLFNHRFEELVLQTDDYTFESILKSVPQLSNRSSLIGYCVEEGRITEEHSSQSRCLYARKYQCSSQLYITEDRYSDETPLKSYGYVIVGWDESKVPILALNFVPRILFASMSWTYDTLFSVLIKECGINREDIIGYYFLNPYESIFSEERVWEPIVELQSIIGDRVEELEDNEWSHPPIFAIYLSPKTSRSGLNLNG